MSKPNNWDDDAETQDAYLIRRRYPPHPEFDLAVRNDALKIVARGADKEDRSAAA